MSARKPEVGDCVRRAMSAAEIAETCPTPELRDAFFALSSSWLSQAELHGYLGRRVADEDPDAVSP